MEPEHQRTITSTNQIRSKLNNLNFDNRVLRSLPIDQEKENYIRTVHNAIYSLVKPTPVKNPRLVAFSKSALQLIDLDENDVQDDDFVLYWSGNKLLNGSQTASQVYAGHQFGVFVGQLGDGAVIYLGEIINDKNQRYEIQLKGAGPTPFSRDADGRKVLRSSIREFLCSEMMFNLGVPTTRAATCITSDDYVSRDIFYTGNEVQERCAVISRIAESFIRFGTFEIFRTRDEFTGRFGPSIGRTDILEQLFDYVISSLYPTIDKLELPNDEKLDDKLIELRNLKCKEFFKQIVMRTAELVALWQTNFWCHGVLNSDNMSILGLTLDYGPFSFIENLDFFYSNGSDHKGRYSYVNQPMICRWNLFKLAETLVHFTPLDELLTIQEEYYQSTYDRVYFEKMRSKFGLSNKSASDCLPCDLASDKKIVDTFLQTLESTGSDVTNGFRNLNLIRNFENDSLLNQQIEAYIDLMINKHSLSFDDMKNESKKLFESQNIQYYLILMADNEESFKSLARTSEKMSAFLNFIDRYEITKDMNEEEKLTYDRKKWHDFFKIYIDRIKHDLKEQYFTMEKRIELMNLNNAKFVLRNHLAQRAIEAAEIGNNDEVERLMRLIERPFEEGVLDNDLDVKDPDYYYRMPSKEQRCQKMTCSS